MLPFNQARVPFRAAEITARVEGKELGLHGSPGRHGDDDGEIIGGGQREDDLALLEEGIAKGNLPKEAFEWYLDLRRYGTVPHAGFGMGVERCVSWICGLHHVRETIPFARMMERITP